MTRWPYPGSVISHAPIAATDPAFDIALFPILEHFLMYANIFLPLISLIDLFV